jgi:simple sugar transport system permease protein
MRLEPIAAPTPARLLGLPVAALALTLAIGTLLAALAGANPLTVFALILKGAAGSKFALLETLNRATPLIFTGLAVAVAFRARLWNIGAEAQLYAGALVTVLLGPAFLKVRFGVDEVVTTLLLNFIMLLFVSMLLEGPLKDPLSLGWPQSPALVPEARLPRIVTGLRLHWGFGLALAAALVTWAIMARTTWGFEMRAVGENAEAAAFAGMPVPRVLLRTAILSGGLAGLAGFSEVAGLKGNLTLDLSPGFGYTGIIVAMLAMLNPLGVVVAGIFVAGVFVGADSMSRAAGVASYIADILVATALLTMVAALKLTRFRIRAG